MFCRFFAKKKFVSLILVHNAVKKVFGWRCIYSLYFI